MLRTEVEWFGVESLGLCVRVQGWGDLLGLMESTWVDTGLLGNLEFPSSSSIKKD